MPRHVLAAVGVAVLSTATAARADCPAIAVVAGDDADADAVRAALAAREVATEAREGCPHLQVTVTARDGHLGLDLVAADGRRIHRESSSAENASVVIAAWIERTATPASEAWVPNRSGLALAIWTDRLRPPAPYQEPGHAAAASPPRRGRVGFGGVAIGGVLAADDQARFWIGPELTGCVRLGDLCVGGALAIATSSGWGGTWQAYSAAVRVRRRFERRAWAVDAGVGLGVSRASARYGSVERVEYRFTSGRLSAGVAASRALGAGLSLEIGVAASQTLARQPRPMDAPDDAIEANRALQLTLSLRAGGW